MKFDDMPEKILFTPRPEESRATLSGQQVVYDAYVAAHDNVFRFKVGLALAQQRLALAQQHLKQTVAQLNCNHIPVQEGFGVTVCCECGFCWFD